MFIRKIIYFFVSIIRVLSFKRLCKFSQEAYYATDNGALDGADVVAYFTQREMVKGNKEFSVLWQGVTWFFSCDEHRVLFLQEPLKYAPQYGGFCAFGLTEGLSVKSQAESWSVVDDKLFLNYDEYTRKLWSRNNTILIEEADSYWQYQKQGKLCLNKSCVERLEEPVEVEKVQEKIG